MMARRRRAPMTPPAIFPAFEGLETVSCVFLSGVGVASDAEVVTDELKVDRMEVIIACVVVTAKEVELGV
jgi:hypothetical protein